MRTEYIVEAWLVALPWVLLGVTVIALWRSVVCGKRWMKKFDRSDANVERVLINLGGLRSLVMHIGKPRFTPPEANNIFPEELKAIEAFEAEARESSAAHREAVRKLEEAKKNLDCLTEKCANLVRANVQMNLDLKGVTPKRLKNGQFAPKKKVK